MSTFSMDLTFIMKALVESLLADGHYNQCNSDLLNDNWHFKINGCGQWLFLEVNLCCFYSFGSWLLVVGRS